MSSRRIDDMIPELQEQFHAFAAEMAAEGIPFILTSTARTVREQVALYAQGREKFETINTMRRLAGLPQISFMESRRKVTWTLNSKHLIDLDDGNTENDKARAFDIAITRDGWPCWEPKADVNGDNIPDYEQAGEIGESVGLRWGGRFIKPDRPHFEI